MRKVLWILLAMAWVLYSCVFSGKDKTDVQVTKIAFGSCSHQDHPLPIFNGIVRHNPDMFIFLGDNIYGDTRNMDTLRSKYRRLGNKKSYKSLRSHMPILATWDDHDYGWNDIGRFYPYKDQSKEIFLDFFEEPQTSSRRSHRGIYHSQLYDYGGNKLQVILLDERTFRDDLKPYSGEFDDDERYDFYQKDYSPHSNAKPTILGETQWSWLEEELRMSADVRIICSGTQFGIEWNGYEAWANFPYERMRMLELIKMTRANGVIFISGDVHYSEISRLETDFYPIFDFTSSGLSSKWKFSTPNKNRVEGPVMDNHFGLITIYWKDQNTEIKMETWDINDNQRIEYTIPLKSIGFKE